MEKLTKEELAEIAERGRILFMAAKGKLEPKDYAAYYIYKRQEEDRNSITLRTTSTIDSSDLFGNMTSLEPLSTLRTEYNILFPMSNHNSNSSNTHSNSSSDNQHQNQQQRQQSVTSSSTSSSSSSSFSPSNHQGGGKYIRKKTLTEASLIIPNDMEKWQSMLNQWIDGKISNLNKDLHLYSIMSLTAIEYSLSPEKLPENYSEQLHNLVYLLICNSKRTPRQKGTTHKLHDDIKKKLDIDSRKEWVTFLNESLIFFDRDSPTSTIAYREKLDYLIKSIIQKLFHNCNPIIKFTEIIEKEIKEAHKNSSAAYRKFTKTSSETRLKNNIKRPRKDFEGYFPNTSMDDISHDFIPLSNQPVHSNHHNTQIVVSDNLRPISFVESNIQLQYSSFHNHPTVVLQSPSGEGLISTNLFHSSEFDGNLGKEHSI